MYKMLSLSLLTMVLLVTGCRIEGEVWVKNSGAGHGVFHVSGIPFVTKSDIENEFSQCDEVTVSDMGGGSYRAEVKWSDFDRVFHARKINEDNTILLHFGEADEAPLNLTVHVNGEIDPKRTSGRLRDSETVVFSPGTEAYLVYEPSSSVRLYLLIAVSIAMVLTVILIIRSNNSAQRSDS